MDPKNVKRKVKPGKIELDVNDSSIVVHYEVESAFLNEEGETVNVEKASSEKRIRVNAINEGTNLSQLAAEIVEKCKLIHPSKQPFVEGLLQQLLQEKTQQENKPVEAKEQKQRRQKADRDMNQQQPKTVPQTEPAEVEKLDDYLEKLYEEKMEDKIKGTFMIMQLARSPDNLEALVQNEAVLSALSRVLNEDGKRSMDLQINIIYVFYSFSHFSQFHPVITQYHVGDVVMRLIDYESKRHELLLKDIKRQKESPAEGDQFDERKFKLLVRKQEKLLYVCFHILLNLAEDIVIERKMKKRKIVNYLVQMLDRKNVDLLILVTTFLKKLSIIKENKTEMVEMGIVERLVRFVPCQNEALLSVVLRLIMNLSFDPAVRDQLVSLGMIPKLVDLLKSPAHVLTVLRLLYQISLDEKCKSMFSFTDAIIMLQTLVTEYPEQYLAKELGALAVNLMSHPRNAETMADNGGLKRLIDRAVRTRDPLLMKIIRNISQHDLPIKQSFSHHMMDLVGLARKAETADLLVETAGVLANCTLPGYEYWRLVDKYDLLDFLNRCLQPGHAEDDVILEVVMFVGTLLEDPRCARPIAKSPLIRSLCDLVIEKQDDDEMILQITYTFYKCILHDDTRTVLLNHTQIVPYLVDLLQDSNTEIRKMADQTLDIIMEFDSEWTKRIRQKKFELHNVEWLDIIEEEESAGRYVVDPTNLYDQSDTMLADDGEDYDAEAWDAGSEQWDTQFSSSAANLYSGFNPGDSEGLAVSDDDLL